MSGPYAQIGADGKARIKNNGLVVAGASDRCCCASRKAVRRCCDGLIETGVYVDGTVPTGTYFRYLHAPFGRGQGGYAYEVLSTAPPGTPSVDWTAYTDIRYANCCRAAVQLDPPPSALVYDNYSGTGGCACPKCTPRRIQVSIVGTSVCGLINDGGGGSYRPSYNPAGTYILEYSAPFTGGFSGDPYNAVIATNVLTATSYTGPDGTGTAHDNIESVFLTVTSTGQVRCRSGSGYNIFGAAVISVPQPCDLTGLVWSGSNNCLPTSPNRQTTSGGYLIVDGLVV